MTRSQETSTPDFAHIVAKVRAAMIDCLEFRDGRYYATDAGCIRLRQILADHGINATVSVDDDERFEVHMGKPQ